MTDLRALVGAGFLLAVMGMVVVAPLVGGPLSSDLVRLSQRRSSRPDRIRGKTNWSRSRFFHAPRTRGSSTKLWRSSSEPEHSRDLSSHVFAFNP